MFVPESESHATLSTLYQVEGKREFLKSILAIMRDNTAPGTDFSHIVCAGGSPMQYSIVYCFSLISMHVFSSFSVFGEIIKTGNLW